MLARGSRRGSIPNVVSPAGETALGIEQRAASREQYFIFSLSIFSLFQGKWSIWN